jgi:hypothetical protein
LLFLSIIQSYAAPYAFMMDRFEIVGNSPGAFVDEFDDGLIGGEWFQYRPTVTESNGQLTLSSPGQSNVYQMGNQFVREEVSAINSLHPGPLSVHDGAGDFTGTSSWLPVLPDVNQIYFMEVFHHLDEHTTESIGIGISNLDQFFANAFGFSTTGMGVFFLKQNPNGDLFVQSASLNLPDISGNISLQLSFSDDSDLFAGNFSLDGGQTFQSPFTVLSPDVLEGEFKWGMHAMSFEAVPIPGAVWLLGSGLFGLAGLRRKLKK